MDEQFFKSFQADLQNEQVWRQYHLNLQNGKRNLKDVVNPSQLGSPAGLKAETQGSSPRNHDSGAQPASRADLTALASTQAIEDPTLSKTAKVTTISDPVSPKATKALTSTQDRNRENATSSQPPPPSGTHKKSTAAKPSSSSSSSPQVTPPAIPPIDASALFWSMMTHARTTDPHIYPALQRLSSCHPFILGALTNNVHFPPNHPFSSASALQPHFNVFIASADVGLRKPQREIYALALGELDAFDRRRGGRGVEAGDVLFLDDIGENLKGARDVGMRTLRVRVGETWRAVEELERILGVRLRDRSADKSRL